ncbi:MAG: SDR family NAD(P)-dependent oxidoreductase, partial [Terriglobia bacterium]
MSHSSKLLDGRVALVTGASQGIGQACAEALAEAGASVALGSRNMEKLEAVAAGIEGRGGRALPLSLDVASPKSIEEGVGRVTSAWSKIDILVNNAGIARDNLLMRMKPEDWDLVLKTNL